MLYEEDPNKGYMKFMGLSLKRRDSCDYLKDVYGGILNILMKDNTTGKILSRRGMGEIGTKISATGLQIEEDGVPFSNSELGGALRKAIDDATKQLK